MLFLLSLNVFAKNFSVQVTPEHEIYLSKSSWVKGSGSFFPGAMPMNVYSHKKQKEYHVFIENLFIPKATLKDRLPKECLHLADKQPEQIFCQYEPQATEGSYAVALTSIYKVSKSNVVKASTVYITGKKQDVTKLIAKFSVDKRLPANKKGRK
jgi:hypothetical protein